MTDALERRVERLEGIEAVRATFNRYLHFLDLGALDDLLGVFTVDVLLEVMNYPPGSGKDLEFRGSEGVRALYGPLRAGAFRHHSANATIVVGDDCLSAELSSYFLTTSPFALGGGLYEGTAIRQEGEWRFSKWRVSSTWGWRIEGQAQSPYLKEALGTGTRRAGHPPR